MTISLATIYFSLKISKKCPWIISLGQAIIIFQLLQSLTRTSRSRESSAKLVKGLNRLEFLQGESRFSGAIDKIDNAKNHLFHPKGNGHQSFFISISGNRSISELNLGSSLVSVIIIF